MTPRRRSIGLVATALATTVALVTLLPQDEGDRPALQPSAVNASPTQALTAGPGAVTARMQREIDRVVAEGLGRTVTGRSHPSALAAQARCAEFEGQRYCLGQGWTTKTQEQVQSRLAATLSRTAARGPRVEQTGDLDPLVELRTRASLSSTARAALERQELTEAARSVAKVWVLRHELQGVPLPAGFLQRHPEVTLSTSTPTAARGTTSTATTDTSGTVVETAAATSSETTTTSTALNTTTTSTPYAEYPDRATVLKARWATEQVRSYWCGPATMQMIAWGWQKSPRSQSHWAGRLGTTSSGTAITQMVRRINTDTGWDNANRAGTYITLDIGSWTYAQWYKLIMRHVRVYRAPVVMHPVLEKQYYSYLDDDASGHFQVGRGYQRRPGEAKLVGYFEPWNQQRFDPSEPYIKRVQWYSAYKQYRANRNHFQHNIGV